MAGEPARSPSRRSSAHAERELVLAEWVLQYTDVDEDDAETRRQVGDIRAELSEKYLSMSRPVETSRCPSTDEVLRYPRDVVDLDGPFWDVRPGPVSTARSAGDVSSA